MWGSVMTVLCTMIYKGAKLPVQTFMYAVVYTSHSEHEKLKKSIT